ncbi:MAG: hypothetical protein Q8O98_02675 [bacterium]|nr:hypothetical protein [bacterium]
MKLRFLFSALVMSLTFGLLGCGEDNPVDASDKPPTLAVSEITTASGGQQAKFSWGNTAVYRLSVLKKETGGFQWSWEVAGPEFAVRNGVVYGSTPSGALCSAHQCSAIGLKRAVPYALVVWYGANEKMSKDFTL